jgi:desulfoferrodoxin-like iron-binding protein
VRVLDKRFSQRKSTNESVRLAWANEINSATVTNVSGNSMCINTRMFLPIETELDVLFPLKNKIIKVHAKVTRLLKREDVHEGMCVEILDPPKEYLEFYESLLSKHKHDSEINVRRINKYVCKICHHVAFDEAPMHCPFCHASIDNFENNPEAVRTVKDFEHLSEFEEKHFPVITISKEYCPSADYECLYIYVKVGKIFHHMKKENHITFIDFYLNEKNEKKRCISRVNLSCSMMRPEAQLCVNDVMSGTVTVVSNCNTHGSWMAEAKF